MDFETKLKNAKEILETLSKPDITLEDSIKFYEQGMKEIKDANKILQDAQIKIETIKSGE
ncbi:MAG: exodeoxyribonuclease VII small subunit [Sulfurimonas sp.]|jgi:exodeoxyribonuclease VII small subunit|nr:exodeoxyribonuclease VII small subunit [Sulfurimonadaceae bacterium]